MPGSKPRRRLVTISMSHYCEKARWALDRAGLAYVEEGHFPNAHYLASFPLARTPFVPILVDSGRVIPDSTAILHHVDGLVDSRARLFPEGRNAEEVARLEDYFDEDLGPTARRYAYWHWFGLTRKMIPYLGQRTPWIERALAPAVIGLMKQMTRKRLAVTREGAEKAIATVRAVFDEVGALLSDGRPYLTGDRFTAADLTFAALSAPVLMPREHGIPLPALDEAPEAMRPEIERLRRTPAGAFALRLYAKERPGSQDLSRG